MVPCSSCGHENPPRFEQKEGYFRETSSDQVMERVDAEGNVLGFSVLKVSALKERPLDVTL